MIQFETGSQAAQSLLFCFQRFASCPPAEDQMQKQGHEHLLGVLGNPACGVLDLFVSRIGRGRDVFGRQADLSQLVSNQPRREVRGELSSPKLQYGFDG